MEANNNGNKKRCGTNAERRVGRPFFLNDLSQKTYLINADYEYCLDRTNYLQKYISSLEQRVELLNAQIDLLEAKGLMRKH